MTPLPLQQTPAPQRGISPVSRSTSMMTMTVPRFNPRFSLRRLLSHPQKSSGSAVKTRAGRGNRIKRVSAACRRLFSVQTHGKNRPTPFPGPCEVRERAYAFMNSETALVNGAPNCSGTIGRRASGANLDRPAPLCYHSLSSAVPPPFQAQGGDLQLFMKGSAFV